MSKPTTHRKLVITTKSLYGQLNLLKYKVARCIDMKKLELLDNYLGYSFEEVSYMKLVDSFYHYYYNTQLILDEITISLKKNDSRTFIINTNKILENINNQLKTAINILDMKIGVLV
jgi:RNA processing factor Prp31